jgi:hypothetical protein
MWLAIHFAAKWEAWAQRANVAPWESWAQGKKNRKKG